MNNLERLQEYIDNETRSCSMDPGCITPLYVYGMRGGGVVINEIATWLAAFRHRGSYVTKRHVRFQSQYGIRLLAATLAHIPSSK